MKLWKVIFQLPTYGKTVMLVGGYCSLISGKDFYQKRHSKHNKATQWCYTTINCRSYVSPIAISCSCNQTQPMCVIIKLGPKKTNMSVRFSEYHFLGTISLMYIIYFCMYAYIFIQLFICIYIYIAILSKIWLIYCYLFDYHSQMTIYHYLLRLIFNWFI